MIRSTPSVFRPQEQPPQLFVPPLPRFVPTKPALEAPSNTAFRALVRARFEQHRAEGFLMQTLKLRQPPQVRLTEEAIDTIFEQAQDQADYLIGLYAAVVPDWDTVENLSGYPGCNNKLWEHIAKKAIEFDKLHHPEVFAGGGWLNRGFTTASVPDWTVTLKECRITYKTEGQS